MLTLDAPDPPFFATALTQAGPTSFDDEAWRLLDLMASVRGSFDAAPAPGTLLDPDRLYHAHGDPRD